MIILHHYPGSPWAEAVRLMLGRKGLAWGSVIQPNMLPKPDQVALTGGYARTPVLQIGADVHCDTTAIADALEGHGPTLFPAGEDHRALAAEAQGPTFFAAVGAAMGGLPARGMEAFWEDRRKRFGMEPEAFRAMTPMLRERFAAHLDALEARLADGRAFLTGDAPGHGDVAHFQLIWFQGMPRGGDWAHAADGRPRLAAWAARVAAFGHGAPTPITPADALAAARDAEPAAVEAEVEPGAFRSGDRVAVTQDGSADPPTVGALLALTPTRITLARDGDATGRVHVHFPRLGQRLAAA